jgi:sugar/nucleoside kinase (ribokinase family)
VVHHEAGARIDVLGLGAVAIDDLLFVAGYPPADSKARVLARDRQFGGLTGTALLAAARIGSRCAYAGVLGVDVLSDLAVENFRHAGIDVEFLRRRAGVGPIRSTIIIGCEDGTRTILSDRNGFRGPDPDWPPEEVIRSSRVLFVDHVGGPGMLRAAEAARAAGVAVVADLEREWESAGDFARLLKAIDHLIVGRTFAARLTGQDDPAAAAGALWQPGRAAAVVTAGALGCWAASGAEGQVLHHQAAFRVPVLDTTGCGDVFHGVYASALARGEPLTERLRLAAAAAALKAARPRGADGVPDRATVEDFLKSSEGKWVDEPRPTG